MILEVNILSFGYNNGRIIFHEVSSNVGEGEILSTLGPNG